MQVVGRGRLLCVSIFVFMHNYINIQYVSVHWNEKIYNIYIYINTCGHAWLLGQLGSLCNVYVIYVIPMARPLEPE